MTRKKERQSLGKAIRRETGIPLPQAMRWGKILVRGGGFFPSSADEVPAEMRAQLQVLRTWVYSCQCGSCDPEWMADIAIQGPKGSWEMHSQRCIPLWVMRLA